MYIHFPLIIGFTAFGVSIEHIVLSNQALALPSSEKWLLCISTFLCLLTLGVIQLTSAMTTTTPTNPVSPSSSSSASDNSKKSTTYTGAIYSIAAATAGTCAWCNVKRRYLNTTSSSYWYHGYSMYRSSHIRCETSSTSSFSKILVTGHLFCITQTKRDIMSIEDYLLRFFSTITRLGNIMAG